jgi:hypothetical protein
VPVDIEQARLRAGVQRLGAQEQFCARRVIGERNDVGGVDDPRVGAVGPVLVQGRRQYSLSLIQSIMCALPNGRV